MRCLGAASPRSASPIGPAPTLLPRIALPPATMTPSDGPDTHQGAREGRERKSTARSAGLEQQAESDDADRPQHRYPDGDPVEVLLGNRRAAEAAGDATPEHVRQTATTTLVQQDHEDEECTAQHEQNVEKDDHNARFYLLFTGLEDTRSGVRASQRGHVVEA